MLILALVILTDLKMCVHTPIVKQLLNLEIILRNRQPMKYDLTVSRKFHGNIMISQKKVYYQDNKANDIKNNSADYIRGILRMCVTVHNNG